MSFGIEVFDEEGGSVFSVGTKYLRIMGAIVIPEEEYIEPRGGEGIHAAVVSVVAIPEGETGYVKPGLGSMPRDLRIDGSEIKVVRRYTPYSMGPGASTIRVVYRSETIFYGYYA